MQNESPNTEVLEAIRLLADNVQDLTNTVESMNTRLTRVESTMVTKSYLDDKLADLRGDVVVMIKNERALL